MLRLLIGAVQGARLREKSERQVTGDEESIASTDSEIEEELGYISPLDTVDPYASFKQALTGKPCSYLSIGISADSTEIAFQMKDGNGYQKATTSLTPEQQMLLMDVMRIAEEHAPQT